MEKLDLLVVIDPVPTATAVIGERKDNTYMLPAGSTMECAGSVTNSQRALQWRDKVINPIFEAKSDYEIAYLFAKKFGFAHELTKKIKVENNEPVAEDILREINRGSWSIGYTGQSPERLKPPCSMTKSKTVAQGGLSFRAGWGVEHEGLRLLVENSAPAQSPVNDGYPEFTMTVLQKLGWAGELTPQEMETITKVARSVLASHDHADGPAKDAAGKHPGESNTLAPPENRRSGDGTQAQEGDQASLGQAPKGQTTSEQAQKEGAGTTSPELTQQIAKVNWKTDLSGGIQRVAIAHGMPPFGNGKARCFVWNYPIRSRNTVSRFTRRGAICCRSMRPIRTGSCGDCRSCTHRSKKRTSPASTPLC